MKKVVKVPDRRAVAPAKAARSVKVKANATVKAPSTVDEAALLGDLRSLVQSARQRIATAANATYTQLCWLVGRRLLAENLRAGRAAYGKRIVSTVSKQLTVEFGAGFGYVALTRMARFAERITGEREGVQVETPA